jgi:hypothetical protein
MHKLLDFKNGIEAGGVVVRCTGRLRLLAQALEFGGGACGSAIAGKKVESEQAEKTNYS